MKRNLNGMVAIITGASAGIGRALADQLSAAGAKLVLAARREDRLHQLNEQLGGRHLVVATDVSDPEQCQRLIQRAAEHFGRIDTLICNAGYGLPKPVAQMSLQEFQAIFQTNLFGTIDCIRPAVPMMSKQELRDGFRGQIVIISSAAGRRGLPWFGAYSATKAAQLSIAESLRIELQPVKIAVTSVHPIGTDTDFFTTAEKLSGATIPPRSAVERHQSAETVAKAIIRGIRRPIPEIWPMRVVRILVAMGILMPRLTDWVMSKHRRALGNANNSPNVP
ncbi:MAG: SDR family NAD(P)-dependent oxidoreductase [Phycisphaerales bacterium]|jgi:NAD(P)-dependent dehydrogenase (short-subunit alcohol dehydrogenase family)|nr:SDR family NAD(P)-dependent oxidoreductase [Phycisphaerales bacterium]